MALHSNGSSIDRLFAFQRRIENLIEFQNQLFDVLAVAGLDVLNQIAQSVCGPQHHIDVKRIGNQFV